jgi:uncharacterized membrane protein YfcA
MIATLLGIIVGLVLGLTGAGGSIFAVPLLIFGLGWSLTQATPVALLAVCGATVFGTITAWRTGQVCQRAALLIGIFGSFTAPAGVLLAARARHDALVLAFAGVMVFVALRLFLQARARPGESKLVRATGARDTSAGAPVCRIDASTSRILLTSPCKIALAISGAAAGVLSGALGVGAGFVIVPALRATTQLSAGSSIATSLMAIAIISATAVAAFLLRGGSVPLVVSATFLSGALAGMLLGRQLAARVAGPRLQQLFATLMLIGAATMAWRELSAAG